MDEPVSSSGSDETHGQDEGDAELDLIRRLTPGQRARILAELSGPSKAVAVPSSAGGGQAVVARSLASLARLGRGGGRMAVRQGVSAGRAGRRAARTAARTAAELERRRRARVSARHDRAYEKACIEAGLARRGSVAVTRTSYAKGLRPGGRLFTAGDASALNLDQYEPPLTTTGPPVFEEQRSGVHIRLDHFHGYGSVTSSPNVFVVGLQGYGKSLFMKLWTTNEVTHEGRYLVVVDAKPTGGKRGEWAEYGAKYGWTVITFGGGVVCVNVLDPRIALDSSDPDAPTQTVLVKVIAETALGRSLRPQEKEALGAALAQIRRSHAAAVKQAGGAPVEQPILDDLIHALTHPSDEAAAEVNWTVEKLQLAGEDVALELRELLRTPVGATINGQTSLGVDLSARAIVFDLSQLASDPMSIPIVMTVVNGFIQNVWAKPGPKRIILIDEATNVLRFLPLARALESSQKVSRGKGIAHWIGVQQVSNVTADRTDPDLSAAVQSVINEAETVVAFRQEPEQARALGSRRNMSEAAIDRLSAVKPGYAVLCVSNRPASEVRVLASPTQVREMQSDTAMAEAQDRSTPEWAGVCR